MCLIGENRSGHLLKAMETKNGSLGIDIEKLTVSELFSVEVGCSATYKGYLAHQEQPREEGFTVNDTQELESASVAACSRL